MQREDEWFGKGKVAKMNIAKKMATARAGLAIS